MPRLILVSADKFSKEPQAFSISKNMQSTRTKIKRPTKAKVILKQLVPKFHRHVRQGLIRNLNVNDVISGRGTHNYTHPGNINFMSLVKKYHIKNRTCPKSLKKVHAKEIFTSIQILSPPGRFLKACFNGGRIIGWAELDDKAVLLKIKQAMRDNALRDQRLSKTLEKHQGETCKIS